MTSRFALILLWLTGLGLLALQVWPTAQSQPGYSLLAASMRQEQPPLADSLLATAPPMVPEHAWQPLDQHTLARWDGPYWLRLQLRIADHSPPPEALVISLRAASQSWWDGQPLGHNGVPGRSAGSEQPGRIDWLTRLDRDQARPGVHTLLVRGSSFHRGRNFASADFYVQLSSLEALARAPLQAGLGVAVAFGSLLAALAFFAVRARAGNTDGAGLLLALGASALLLLVTESARLLLGYPYPLHPWRLWAILALTLAVSVLLPSYLARRFQLRLPVWTLWLALLLVLCIPLLATGFDLIAGCLHLLALLASLAVLWRVRAQSLAGGQLAGIATILLLGLLSLLLTPQRFADQAYFVCIGALLVLLLVQHARHLDAARQRLHELDADRARLQAELLRQSIHPHWLMNTLSALQELIEQQPIQASRMVEALGREFALLRSVSSYSLIALTDELALCRVHLEIMAMARLAPFALEVEGQVDDVQVPPGILHVLVENGLTHAGLRSDGMFQLQVERGPAGVSLRLSAPLGSQLSSTSGSSGTGSRFLAARLQTEFPQRHQLAQQAVAGRWITRIELFEQPQPCTC